MDMTQGGRGARVADENVRHVTRQWTNCKLERSGVGALLAAGRPSAPREPHPRVAVAQDTEADGTDQDQAADGALPEGRDVAQLEPVLDHAQEEAADRGAEQAAVAA